MTRNPAALAPPQRPAWRAALWGALIGGAETLLVLGPLLTQERFWQWSNAYTGSGLGGAYRVVLALAFMLCAALGAGMVVGALTFRQRRQARSMWGVMLVFQALTGAACIGIFALLYLLWPR